MQKIPRILLACDVPNVYKVCREEYGPNARVNFEILRDAVVSFAGNSIISLVAYIITHPKATHYSFSEILAGTGYQVKERCIRYADEISGPLCGDWSLGLTIDALNRTDDFDTFILVVGDNDYEPLISEIKSRGKEVIVLTFESAAARVLYGAADRLFFLSESIVYRQSLSNGE